ncbi:MAG TPA: hypothetical protein VER03_18140 [Bryobacteraceae bacterium]|nr:hypothetical protein [Bryobacteraceae bacterium]
MKRFVLALTVLALPVFAGGGSDFDSMVRSMENHYGVKKTYIPFLGFANFVVKVARPAGARDFKLAIFEHVDQSRHPSLEDMDRRFVSAGWKPFVRVLSNRKRERVQIYAREKGRDHELMVTTFENDETVMVRVRINAEGMAKWVNNPRAMCGRNSR